MIYFIDFDGTICPGEYMPPSKECIRVLKRLKECNNTIVIYSCRSNPKCVEDAEIATRDMIKYLKQYNIPYDRIEPNKPYYNYIIDDRNVCTPLDKNFNVDWEKVEKNLKENKLI